MKKFISIFLILITISCLVACNNKLPSKFSSVIPEPNVDYEINYSNDEYMSLEVENASENDFRSYIKKCEKYGFNGSIKSAESPDLYFMEHNDEGYYLEVFFYENDQRFTIFVRSPND